MFGWDEWKKGFDRWEITTARLLESWLRSPFLVAPSGALLDVLLRTKAARDRIVDHSLGALGLATKRDQERTLHAINQLESKIFDLQERLEEARRRG